MSIFNKEKFAGVLLSVVVNLSGVPVRAATINQPTINPADAGSNDKQSPPGANTGNHPKPTASSKQLKLKSLPKILVTAPARLLKASPGFIVGAPIATTRKVIDESKQATIDLAGDNRNPVVLSVLSLLGIPAGILTGGTEGPAVAAVNGWKYADTKPFSKEYFSLEEEKSQLPPEQQ